MLYLDHAASSPLRPQAWEAMAPFRDEDYGNPSGGHAVSRRAKNALEDARDLIAGLIGSDPLEIVFTGGGTEADNLAVKGAALAGGEKSGVVTSTVEHDAVLASAGFVEGVGCPLALVKVDADGLVDPAEVASHVTPETAVVSVMMGNNETGVRQPIEQIADEIGAVSSSVVFHSDAVQGYVSERIDLGSLGVDLLSLAAHKFGGPKGVGLLFVRSGTRLEPLIHGGGQELGRRSGTHNVMAVVGMAAAMAALESEREDFRPRVMAERNRFETTLASLVPDVAFTAANAPRMVQTSHVRIPGIRNEVLLVRLDAAGVAASAASACQSGAATVSHVLEAMGMTPAEARECLRFSFGWSTPEGEGAAAARLVAREIEALR
ncbi:MAG: cysteine desulfurase family protein [bacterium]|nr:cysteine desulfurase family protein [bacterium]MDE0287144.1 cysteine desulfurase family protein [bacterium]MDE0437487.1 cysteine desulfurase family protein [bacterium]